MLTDRYLRRHNYLRLSVTDRCNLRCVYCVPADDFCHLPHESILRNEEFIRLIDVFVSLGIDKIRFTGGEPLIRKGLMDIIRTVRERYPSIELALTTNGMLLKEHLPGLKDAGVKRLNISLDTLDHDRFFRITGAHGLERVLESIDAAVSMNFFSVKINVVLMPETLDELEDFLRFLRGKHAVLRFIEMMPDIGGDSGKPFMPAHALIARLQELGTLERQGRRDSQVAMMYSLARDGEEYPIGIIPPVSHGFCGKCNRLRLTADGQLKSCLYSKDEFNLKDVIRSGASDNEITAEIRKAVDGKGEDRIVNTGDAVSRTMSKIGG